MEAIKEKKHEELDEILEDDKGLLDHFEQEEDYEGIKTGIRREIELLKISSGAKPRVNSGWEQDPFISYRKMSGDPQILSERNSKPNYVKENITRAGKAQRGLITSNQGSLGRLDLSADIGNDKSLGISPITARMRSPRMLSDNSSLS